MLCATRQAVDKYLKEKNLPYKALVAFSGTVKDGGIDYTETGMNGFPETQTAKTFERDEYRLLIVAEKFQTGFDQPLLHTMYVDKRLTGLHAVQTLSRLNRIHPAKRRDNGARFCQRGRRYSGSVQALLRKHTALGSPLIPTCSTIWRQGLKDLTLLKTGSRSICRVSTLIPKATQDKLLAALDPVVTRFEALDEAKKDDFKGTLQDYVRLYAFCHRF